jgi:hypothetical protein
MGNIGAGAYAVEVALWLFVGATSIAVIVADYTTRRFGADVLHSTAIIETRRSVVDVEERSALAVCDVCIGLGCLGLGVLAGVATRTIYLLLSLP